MCRRSLRGMTAMMTTLSDLCPARVYTVGLVVDMQ
jgi:hypothetical protein